MDNDKKAMLRQKLADAIRSKRIAGGWTQQKVADYCGCSRGTYLALETRGEGSVDLLLSVFYALGVSDPVLEAAGATGADFTRRRISRKAVDL